MAQMYGSNDYSYKSRQMYETWCVHATIEMFYKNSISQCTSATRHLRNTVSGKINCCEKILEGENLACISQGGVEINDVLPLLYSMGQNARESLEFNEYLAGIMSGKYKFPAMLAIHKLAHMVLLIGIQAEVSEDYVFIRLYCVNPATATVQIYNIESSEDLELTVFH